MFWMSFFGHLGDVRRGAQTEPGEGRLTVVLGVLFAVTVLGLVLSLAGGWRRRAG